ncbi:Sec-independent protein translocase protein TatB [Halioxenophilus aromaticivorans]|uniref:Sec-independent protein translocase protein TatB n=1 Tax=Halioxenophilus aromaticivorans TaxID=1306992 RepID=A0AAV3U5Y1_9ALTE
MFDIGFFELLVIAVVGLLVIGPERLPETIRGILLTIGRVKRGLSNTRQELERQIGADDIRRQLHNEEIMARLEQTRQDIDHTLNTPKAIADDIKSSFDGSATKNAGDEPVAEAGENTRKDDKKTIQPAAPASQAAATSADDNSEI